MKKNWIVVAVLAMTWCGANVSAQGAHVGNAVNITTFGVKCDGVTDDTPAINKALNQLSGLSIQFPAGICLYAGGGVIQLGTVLVGAGRTATVIGQSVLTHCFLTQVAMAQACGA